MRDVHTRSSLMPRRRAKTPTYPKHTATHTYSQRYMHKHPYRPMCDVDPLEPDAEALGELVEDKGGGGRGEGEDDAGAAGAAW